jgi:hypothetical protein
VIHSAVSQALRRGDAPRVSRRTRRSREILVNDGLFRELIALRDGKVCQYPGCGTRGKGVQVAHVFTRSRFSVRWDEDNGIALCGGHHIFWAHKHPTRFNEFVRKRLGDERFNRLLVRSEQSAKGQDLAAVRLYLLQRIKELKASLQEADGAEPHHP